MLLTRFWSWRSYSMGMRAEAAITKVPTAAMLMLLKTLMDGTAAVPLLA